MTKPQFLWSLPLIVLIIGSQYLIVGRSSFALCVVMCLAHLLGWFERDCRPRS